jgi:ribosomal protein S18 acetylase RimI-like enzyme
MTFLRIRPYRAEELPAILAASVETALAQLVERDRTAAGRDGVVQQLYRMYQQALAVPEATILVAEGLLTPPALMGRPEMGGYMLLMPQPNSFTGERELVVLDIYVHPHLRGQGVGRRLLAEAGAYARAVHCHGLVAQVALHNRDSLRLFTRSGFIPERLILGRLV